MYDAIIVDADLCLKLGQSQKYPYLEILLPLLAEHIFIHETVNNEIKTNRTQIDKLLRSGKLTVLSERDLKGYESDLYPKIQNDLSRVMSDPNAPRKNQGEIDSLAMAKTKGIHYFATDERNLQPIIDEKLNAGLGDDLKCVRIIDIIELIKRNELYGLQRKDAKLIWIISNKSRDDFDTKIWPI